MNSSETEIDDVRKSTFQYIRLHYLRWFAVYFIFVIFSIWVIHVTGIMEIIVLDFIIGSLGYGYVYSQIQVEFIKQFGESIGYNYSPSAPLTSVSGKLFQVGNYNTITNVLSGVYQNIPLRIYTYRYIVDNGKDSHTYSYTVFESTFSNIMPEILLYQQDKPGVGFFGFGSGMVSLKLESEDFNKRFALFVPKGNETEAYQIFTPDVMADLIDKVDYFNFEFNQKKLYIYYEGSITTRVDMQKACALIDYLVTVFMKNISEMPIVESKADPAITIPPHSVSGALQS